MSSKEKSIVELADFSTDKRMLVLSALALPIGVASAFVAQALVWLIAVITNIAFYHRFSSAGVTPEGHTLGFWVVVVPVVGAIIIGFMARFGSQKIRGHGIPEALEAILLGRSLIDPRVAFLKPLSSAVSIGTGGPFGAEGPIIMTGGAFGSIFAQFFKLTAAERKTLLVAGAAGGMAAIFATPIAAVLLAVELLLFEWKPRSFVPVAVASIVAALVRVPLLGPGPIFPVPLHAPMTATGLAVALLIGVAVGLGSCGVTGLVYAFEDLFAKLKIHWMWWPAIGAVVIGLGGWVDPRVLGVGYDIIHLILLGQLIGKALLILLIIKAVIWAVALGSGTSGGVLAPLLMVGGGIGAYLAHWMPTGDTGLWAMVGMGAVMAGTMRAPLTGILFVLELTHDFNVLPGLLVGCVAALAVTVLLLRRSILTEKLARRGQHISCEYSVNLFELTLVSEVMEAHPPTVLGNVTVSELSARIAKGDPDVSRRQGVLIVDEKNQLAGIITRGDVMRALPHNPKMPVLEAGQTDLVVAYPDEPLREVIATMLTRDIGRVPVVERGQPRKIVGYLGRADILAATMREQREEELRERGPLLAALWRGAHPDPAVKPH
ncbi:MAG TPA: chloride channel protein [Verrucomicrobiae bacterium]|nr:chloride channel protein [Verrucomicrobiae bacterium]